MSGTPSSASDLILYRKEDDQVRLENETVRLSLALDELFEATVSHIQNIFEEGELDEEATFKDYLIVQKEGSREVSHYNLEAVTAMGYRVHSRQSNQHRIAEFAATFSALQIVTTLWAQLSRSPLLSVLPFSEPLTFPIAEILGRNANVAT